MKLPIESYTVEDIEIAYRKLKSYVYYDNYSLLIRAQLSKFEGSGNFNNKLKGLSDQLNKYVHSDIKPDILNKIENWILPKKLKSYEEHTSETVLSNVDFTEDYTVESLIYYINAPVEIHILAVLWIIKIGYQLEKLVDPSPYGNKLELNENGEVVQGIRLFTPYYNKYQDWRDGAITSAKSLLSSKRSALLLGLDIKEFYNSVRFDFGEINTAISKSGTRNFNVKLTNLLEIIHATYSKLILGKIEEKQYLLPIGLLSSGLIGNWYLRHFDREILSRLNPVYYGRYVDDILIVISNAQQRDIKSVKNVYSKYFASNGLLSIAKSEKNSEKFVVLPEFYPKENMEIQKNKFTIFYINKDEPTGMLDKFSEEIKKNRSEFRFLPDDKIVKSEFDKSAYSLSFSGSKLRLRSLTGFDEDKFEISKFLAKKIFLSLNSDDKIDLESKVQIINFFKGKRTIEFRDLWEKSLTYFLIQNLHKEYLTVVNNAIKAIDKLTYSANDITSKLKYSLRELLKIAIKITLSLNPSFYDTKTKYPFEEIFIDPDEIEVDPDWVSDIYYFRKSNLLRHKYITYPLINYSYQSTDREKGINFLDTNFKNVYKKYAPFEIDESLTAYSPRFIHFHEIAINEFYNRLYNTNSDHLKIDLNKYLDTSIDKYAKYNFARELKYKSNNDFKEEFFKTKPCEDISDDTVTIEKFELDQEFPDSLFRIAVANMRVEDEILGQKYLRRPKVSSKRRDQYYQLFNDVIRETRKVDAFVLPEISMPYKYLFATSKLAQQKNLSVFFGLEHLILNRMAYNLIVGLVPITFRSFTEVVPFIRIKNHYSPEEKLKLEGYGYFIPNVKPFYYLINWRNMQFTFFNCYELADIKHRALFKSKIDLFLACEFNKDTNYFSNIVESTSREIHCYFVQSNNAKYGDSRITKPSSTETKDLIKIKGGQNYTILIEEINIEKLRNFQLLDYNLQKDDNNFKPTPPDFNKKEVEDRME